MTKIIVVIKGGTGSGNWGHSGRPGLVGGSATGLPAFKAQLDNLIARFGVPCGYTESSDVEGLNIIEGTVGSYSPDINTIYINPKLAGALPEDTGADPSGELRNTTQLGWQFLITHEYGHALDIALSSPSLGSKWNDIVRAYNDNHEFDMRDGKYKNNESVLSSYSLGIGYAKYTESFAEAFAAYVLRPQWLQTNNPDMHQFFADMEGKK